MPYTSIAVSDIENLLNSAFSVSQNNLPPK
jgi:hypothetical protein